MSEFIRIVSNVKVINCMTGSNPILDNDKYLDCMEGNFPQVDVLTCNGAVHIFADLPGVRPEDIYIYIYDNLLILEGSKSFNTVSESHTFIRVERRSCPFRRIFELPFIAESYEAAVENGVLHIVLTDN